MYNQSMKELEKKTIRYIERMIELIKFTQYPRTKEDMARFLFKENTSNKNKELNVYFKSGDQDFNLFNTNVPIHFEEFKEKGKRKSLWYSGTRSVLFRFFFGFKCFRSILINTSLIDNCI